MKPQPHYIGSNHREASPHLLMVADTETETLPGPVPVQVLRLWRAELILRHARGEGLPRITATGGHTAAELADLLDAYVPRRGTLWVYFHNLAFDLAVTRLPVLLCERRWTLTEHALASDAPWARFALDERRIVLADTLSIFPASVAQLGRVVGIRKPDLPSAGDGEQEWNERCAADVRITRTALLQLLDWWDAERLGDWKVTGPSLGWATMRHRDDWVPVVADPTPGPCAWEHRMILGGRRDVWRVGKLGPGLFADIDFEHAHLAVAQHFTLPYCRKQTFGSLPLDHPWLRVQSVDVAAECLVHTATPRYPLASDMGVVHPVGTFWTRLCGPEIRDALARGDLLEIGEGRAYGMGRSLQPWATWCEQLLEQRVPGAPPVATIAAKGWSRTVTGRFAGRTGRLVDEWPDPRPGWILEEGWITNPAAPADGDGAEVERRQAEDLPPRRIPARFLTIGGRYQVIAQDQDVDSALPAVLAWVQSHTRVLLGRLVDALAGAVVQCNTDGAIVDVLALDRIAREQGWWDGDGAENPQALLDRALGHVAGEIAPLRARVKRLASRVTVIGPQHVILDDERRLSGVPHLADQVGETTFSFEVWPSMREQIRAGSTLGYVMGQRTVDLATVPVPGWVAADGYVWPPAVEVDELGENRILPMPAVAYRTGWFAQGVTPHPALRDAWERGMREAGEG